MRWFLQRAQCGCAEPGLWISDSELPQVVVVVQTDKSAPFLDGQRPEARVRSERPTLAAPLDKPLKRGPPRVLVCLPSRGLCALELGSGGQLPVQPREDILQELAQREGYAEAFTAPARNPR